jgi:hypothetical protein
MTQENLSLAERLALREVTAEVEEKILEVTDDDTINVGDISSLDEGMIEDVLDDYHDEDELGAKEVDPDDIDIEDGSTDEADYHDAEGDGDKSADTIDPDDVDIEDGHEEDGVAADQDDLDDSEDFVDLIGESMDVGNVTLVEE